MPISRLEQQDSYRQTFESRVSGTDGEWLRLEESLFYPTSGGQPHDTGFLNGQPVTDVVKRGDEVWHRLEGEAFQVGQAAQGVIDWPRRYRHMQRHSAQHLLSQAFLQVDGAFETQSVSLSGPVCTVDFSGEPGDANLEAAETLVNEVAYQNLPIHAFEVPDFELADYPLRRPPKVSGQIRLVQMGDFELSPCGGTHLKSTAEALPIKLLRRERVRGGLTRVYFCAGWEALADYRLKHGVSSALANTFSSPVEGVLERVNTTFNDLADLKKKLTLQTEALAELTAEKLLVTAQTSSKGRIVRYELPPQEAELLSPLANSLTRHEDVTALLGVRTETGSSLLFARGAQVTIDMSALLKTILPLVDGRGGGKPDRAQGGGKDAGGLTAALDAAAAQVLADT